MLLTMYVLVSSDEKEIERIFRKVLENKGNERSDEKEIESWNI